MKVSRAWLQKHFDTELPDTATLADALTFHAFEIEEYDADMLDVKVLPDRAAYGLSHRGIAYELSAILGIPMKYDQFVEPLPEWKPTDGLTLTMSTPKANRHMGALIKGVKVGPSPEWLKASLESVGARSINNIVDATNCVTLAMGQPLHAFDAAKIGKTDGKVHVGIRETKGKESVTVLSGETYELPEGTLVLCEGEDGKPLDIAGIKGGKGSAITEDTTELFVSVANFDATAIRRAARALSLWTDASLRFQNNPSADLVPYGMRQILDLITSIAGGEVVGVNDLYPNKELELPAVAVTLDGINGRLGSSFTKDEVKDVFTRLDFEVTETSAGWTVVAPFVRRDVVIPEDVSEEVGRILGYDRVPSVPLTSDDVVDMARWRGIERVKDLLIERGFSEISTPSFNGAGDILLSNPLQSEKPYLRARLTENMQEALTRAGNVAPRVLGPAPAVKLFEIGNIFGNDGERLSLAVGVKVLQGKKGAMLAEAVDALSELIGMDPVISGDVAAFALGEADLEKLGEDYEPQKISLTKFRPFSIYPFALRDIAVWTPEGTEEDEVAEVISKEAGDLLTRLDLFDRFEKDGKTSFALRLVFESFEKTLSDTDIDPVMKRVTDALNAKPEWRVR